jgi:hypothetical protein
MVPVNPNPEPTYTTAPIETKQIMLIQLFARELSPSERITDDALEGALWKALHPPIQNAEIKNIASGICKCRFGTYNLNASSRERK